MEVVRNDLIFIVSQSGKLVLIGLSLYTKI